ncbi:spermidine synthase [Sulfobacillus acidophilus TPY]|uniref:Polyamine aminopropyltransferase n=1 Tax=Sulfobacillus acidophilus (strain ATCC 700253 / DSM 10332 / NAL) TaxID=679936 RepID=G8TUE4_SULAD|nr:spermidine synthase [Sulfobacillus acidophilus TPY]AEW06906.1 Spermidine synthase [Sulfobacillus acidophilus DSM 10332]
MNTWFTENQTDALRLGLRLKSVLAAEKTPYQELMVAETETYGRLLALDNYVQTTVADEFVYHEMITHVPLFMHPHPKQVAVIGGGDGGAIREILKHPSVEKAHLVEIDERVVTIAREYFPEISHALSDPRAELHFTDGIEWIRQARQLDVVIVDSTDPIGPAEGLFQSDFYHNIRQAMTEDGVMVAQSESPFLHRDLIRHMARGMRAWFEHVALYTAAIPTYPSGYWSFLMASSKPLVPHPRYQTANLTTRYWTPGIQTAAFVLPRFVEEILHDV